MEQEKKPMKKKEILESIEMLAKSQGFYGRFRERLRELEEEDPYAYEALMTDLENEEFLDVVDLVLFLET